jgi:hypothetical protein
MTSTSTTKLTAHQRLVLEALRKRGVWATVPDLQNRRLLNPEQEPQGFHQTLASLVRRGLVDKSRHHGHVFYRLAAAAQDGSPM